MKDNTTNLALLESATFRFSQDGNCVDGGDELLEVRMEAPLGLDRDGEVFYIIKTDQWALNNVDELSVLFNRIAKLMPKK